MTALLVLVVLCELHALMLHCAVCKCKWSRSEEYITVAVAHM